MNDLRSDRLEAALPRDYPALGAIAELASAPAYLVGGAVRDLLLGLPPSGNLDLVVEGDAGELARLLGAEVVDHERFATATVEFRGLEVDIASARTESYRHPGALPEVEAGATIEADLSRRDFTVNALAVPLREPRLIDPHGGAADLESRLLRVLHDGSFVDDPTRALRAARYASRLDFSLEDETEALLRASDLGTVSGDRREAELMRLASEARAVRGFELLGEWGLLEPRPGGIALAAAAERLLRDPGWAAMAQRDQVLCAAVLGPAGAEAELAAAQPERPSVAVALASGRDPVELILARALGAAWLDPYLDEWRHISLEIDGSDLVAAGVAEGPAVGAGLAEALRRKLDGELEEGREAELAAAVAAAEDDDALV